MDNKKPTPADAFRNAAKIAEETGEALKKLADAGKPSEKKPYIRPQHLTSKPFQDHQGLRKLQSDLHRRDNTRIDPKARRQR
jgi:hypothetical protein